MTQRLPLGLLLKAAVQTPFKQWHVFVPAYVVLVSLSGYAFDLLMLEVAEGESRSISSLALIRIARQVGFSMVCAVFAVLVHRKIATIDRPWDLLSGTLAYWSAAILIVLPILIVSIPFMVIVGNLRIPLPFPQPMNFALLQFATFGVYGALLARFGLAFPAAALGHKKPISLAWSLSRGNVLPLWLGPLILTSVSAIINALYSNAIDVSWNCSRGGSSIDIRTCQSWSLAETVLIFLSIPVNYITFVAGIAFLTHSYLRLNSDEEGPERHHT